MEKMERTLVVRHLPEELGENDQADLLSNFGASHVRSMGHKGRLKHVAFATFPDEEAASLALKRLHQLEILGHKLIVEFSKKNQQKLFPTELKQLKVSDLKDEETDGNDEADKERKKKEESQRQKARVAQEINKMSERFGMDYPLNPKLQYLYRPPTVQTLTNIANALASVPKFYVQVLHLMNKMNLPPPFDVVTATPPLAEETKPEKVEVQMEEIREPDVLEPAEMEMSSEEESELESDEDESLVKQKENVTAAKRTKRQGLDKPRKRAKLQLTNLQATMPRTTFQKVEEVFEVPQAGGAKKAEFRLTPISNQPQLYPGTSNELPSKGKDSEQSNPATNLAASGSTSWDIPSNTDLLKMTEPQAFVDEGGFGKLEPVAKPTEDQPEDDEGEEEEWGATEFISSRKLRRNRIKYSEMRDISAFRKYQEGEPTSRLYIKNISRQVSEKDLHYVFGKYVNWEEEAQKLVFDIRLMKEGKMKGQAFITLPNEKQALEALRDTHGFMMKGKPIVVQFARSAKPKEKDEKDKGGKS